MDRQTGKVMTLHVRRLSTLLTLLLPTLFSLGVLGCSSNLDRAIYLKHPFVMNQIVPSEDAGKPGVSKGEFSGETFFVMSDPIFQAGDIRKVIVPKQREGQQIWMSFTPQAVMRWIRLPTGTRLLVSVHSQPVMVVTKPEPFIGTGPYVPVLTDLPSKSVVSIFLNGVDGSTKTHGCRGPFQR